MHATIQGMTKLIEELLTTEVERLRGAAADKDRKIRQVAMALDTIRGYLMQGRTSEASERAEQASLDLVD